MFANQQRCMRGSRDDRLPHPVVPPDADPEDPERIAIRESLAFGKAVYDRRTALGLTSAEVALRAGMTADQIECIEEGGTEATIGRRVARAAVLLAGQHVSVAIRTVP